MKICQVVLVLTLGTGVGAVLTAQSLPTGAMVPADTVMVASETMPGGVELFPEFLASSHSALLRGLPVDPAVSQGIPKPPVTTTTEPKPLTGMDRLTLFWNKILLCLPGSFRGHVSAGALRSGSEAAYAGQVRFSETGSVCVRRLASEYGQLATRNEVHDGY